MPIAIIHEVPDSMPVHHARFTSVWMVRWFEPAMPVSVDASDGVAR